MYQWDGEIDKKNPSKQLLCGVTVVCVFFACFLSNISFSRAHIGVLLPEHKP